MQRKKPSSSETVASPSFSDRASGSGGPSLQNDEVVNISVGLWSGDANPDWPLLSESELEFVPLRKKHVPAWAGLLQAAGFLRAADLSVCPSVELRAR